MKKGGKITGNLKDMRTERENKTGFLQTDRI